MRYYGDVKRQKDTHSTSRSFYTVMADVKYLYDKYSVLDNVLCTGF